MFESYNGGIENTRGKKFNNLKRAQQYLYAKKEIEDYYDVLRNIESCEWFIKEVIPYLIKLRDDNLFNDAIENLADNHNNKILTDEELLKVIESTKNYDNKYELILNASHNSVDAKKLVVGIKNNDFVKDYILNFLTSNHIFCDLGHTRYINLPNNLDELIYNCYLEELRLESMKEKLDFIKNDYGIELDLSNTFPHYDVSDTFTLKKTNN